MALFYLSCHVKIFFFNIMVLALFILLEKVPSAIVAMIRDISLLAQEVWGFILGQVKSDTVSPALRRFIGAVLPRR